MNRVSPPRRQDHQGPPPALSTQRRGGGDTDILCVARSRPSDGRGPLGRESASKTSFRTGFSTQRLALSERKPRHLSSFFVRWDGDALPLPTNEREKRQNRRAPGTSAGEKPDDNESSLSGAAGFSPATGDSIASRSAGNQRHRISCSAIIPLRLCVFAFLWVGGSGFAAKQLRRDKWICVICGQGWVHGFAPLRFSSYSPLASWCLGGSKTTQPS
jgi:hypothetical protein